MSISLASIHIYPIKSLGGFAVEEARTTDRGFEHDRRWMLVDPEGRFITQREQPAMALLRCTERPAGFRVTDARTGGFIDLPWEYHGTRDIESTVFNDRVRVVEGEQRWSAWFSAMVGSECRIVYMPDDSHRQLDRQYAEGINSLSDGFPYLIISQASLDDLNARLESAVPMNRFRPNLVIAGGEAFQEDAWKQVSIGGVKFDLVKTCGRCVITTTDQQTGERSKEPLRTLASYRTVGSRALFGMNAVCASGRIVRVGTEVLT